MRPVFTVVYILSSLAYVSVGIYPMNKKVNERRRVVICGAAGRYYHNFNTVYRNAPDIEVVAFTATQIPGIAGRSYPASLAGEYYPDGIPIIAESHLETLIVEQYIDEVA